MPQLDRVVICAFGVIADTDNLPPQDVSNIDVIDDIVEQVNEPPYLSPEPQSHLEVDAGSSFKLFIGQPISSFGNEVEI